MSRYIIETRTYVSLLRGLLRKATLSDPRLSERLLYKVSEIPLGLLNETVLRLFWNDLNIAAKYPWETWDDEGIISQWFKDFSMAENQQTNDLNVFVADELSEVLYDTVISPVIDNIHSNIYDLNLRENWNWEEFKIEEVRISSFILRSLGDFRISDWERLKREYEPDYQGRKNDPRHFYSAGLS